jgi:heme-degrading monooxygenase HmoA
MPEPTFYPPPPEVAAAMGQIPGMQLAPSMLVLQEGPEGEAGPEAAGAILWLQATFAGEEGARCFWEASVPLMALLAEAPGFIRRYSFAAHQSANLIALWRTVEDAKRFAASPAHREASRALFAGRWQASHFSALWEMRRNHGRVFFCQHCDGITPAPATECGSCRAPISDVYRMATAG